MKSSRPVLLALLAAICLAGSCKTTPAAVTSSDDVDPFDPTTWTTATTAYVGKTSEGRVTVDSGSTIESYDGYLGYETTATGHVTVTGSNSKWTNSGDLCVGYNGMAKLLITDGGAASSSNGTIGTWFSSTGEVTVSGAGSTWTSSNGLDVGLYGDGTLMVTDGGTVSSSSGRIGLTSGSTSEVTVSGTGSTWTNSFTLGVGGYGTAKLLITDNGAVSNSSGYVGADSGSTGVVTVSGTGSTWANSDNLYVGYGYLGNSNGTLAITNGGSVSNSSNGSIGYHSGSTGVVTVSGTGSTWTNSSNLTVGYEGSGTLEITQGGLVSVGGVLTIDDDGDGDSFINMSTGGMLALYGNADDSLAEFLDLVDGTDAIRYWDVALDDWADITSATPGTDYELAYLDEVGHDLYGYTLLTVRAIPEPSTVELLLLASLCLCGVRRRHAKHGNREVVRESESLG